MSSSSSQPTESRTSPGVMPSPPLLCVIDAGCSISDRVLLRALDAHAERADAAQDEPRLVRIAGAVIAAKPAMLRDAAIV